MYLDYLHELAQHIPLNQLIIPPAVRKSVANLLTHITRPFTLPSPSYSILLYSRF